MSISNVIKSIQDIMRMDAGVDGDAQRIGQLVWILFLKIYDDREQDWEFFDDAYQSPIPEQLRWRNWAADPEGITGDDLKKFIDQELFSTLQNLVVTNNPRAAVIRGVFADAYNYMKSGQLIRQVINKVQEGIDFNQSQQRHAFGDMYEQILRDLQSAGNAGEFYTPRALTEFMVNRVDPKLADAVMDPACGTGGFLTCAIEHKRKRYAKTAEDDAVLQKSIFGIEKKPLPHLLATTNMILHGIDVPSQIEHDNTLARPRDAWKSKTIDVILANPPFGGTEEGGIERNFPPEFQTRETADLFMVLFMNLLKDGGRAAVVLPDGFLFGEGMKSRLKEKLMTDCNLHTIVRLPNGVFAPYTGIKTNILFFTKGQPTETIWYYEHPYPDGVKSYNKTKPIRFEEFATEIDWWGSAADGFASRVESEQAWRVDFKALKADATAKAQPYWDQAQADKITSQQLKDQIDTLKKQIKANKDQPASDQPTLDLEPEALPQDADALNQLQAQLLDAQQAAVTQQRRGDDLYWPIYNLDIKNPHRAEQVSHDPDELLALYAAQQAEMQGLRDQIKAVLAAALAPVSATDGEVGQ